LTLVGLLVLVGLIAWGIYLYLKVNEIDRKITRYHSMPPDAVDDH